MNDRILEIIGLAEAVGEPGGVPQPIGPGAPVAGGSAGPGNPLPAAAGGVGEGADPGAVPGRAGEIIQRVRLLSAEEEGAENQRRKNEDQFQHRSR